MNTLHVYSCESSFTSFLFLNQCQAALDATKTLVVQPFQNKVAQPHVHGATSQKLWRVCTTAWVPQVDWTILDQTHRVNSTGRSTIPAKSGQSCSPNCLCDVAHLEHIWRDVEHTGCVCETQRVCGVPDTSVDDCPHPNGHNGTCGASHGAYACVSVRGGDIRKRWRMRH